MKMTRIQKQNMKMKKTMDQTKRRKTKKLLLREKPSRKKQQNGKTPISNLLMEINVLKQNPCIIKVHKEQ
jgi:hypothetical protein